MKARPPPHRRAALFTGDEIAALAARYAEDDAQAMAEMKAGLSFREALAKFARI